MTFAGMNHLAIVIAAIVAWIGGAAWYGLLGKPWVAAQGKTMDEFKAQQAAQRGTLASYVPFILAFVAEFVMAWVLAGVVGHLGPGQVTIRNAIISGLFIWLGFVLTTMAVNNAFTGRKTMLTVIDGGHWLLVLVLEGLVIGWMDVN